METLINNNVIIEGEDENGETPLMRNIERGNLKKVEELFRLGANPNHSSSSFSPSLLAASSSLEMTKLLHKYGTNLNYASLEGETPLHMAAFYGNEETIKEIMKLSGNLEVQANIRTPFMAAATKGGKKENMKILKEIGQH